MVHMALELLVPKAAYVTMFFTAWLSTWKHDPIIIHRFSVRCVCCECKKCDTVLFSASLCKVLVCGYTHRQTGENTLSASTVPALEEMIKESSYREELSFIIEPTVHYNTYTNPSESPYLRHTTHFHSVAFLLNWHSLARIWAVIQTATYWLISISSIFN